MRNQESIRRALRFFLLVALAIAVAVSIEMYVLSGGPGDLGSGPGGTESPDTWRLDSAPLMSVGDTESDPLHEVAGIVMERMLTAMGLPEHLPPYGWLSLGYPDRPPVTVADGLVWALRYGGFPRQGIEPDGPEWFVFQPGVGQIATLSSPDDVVLFNVAGDLAAVLRRTELGEEVVELRRIVGRQAAAGPAPRG